MRTLQVPKSKANYTYNRSRLAKSMLHLLTEEYLENFNLPQDDTMVYACGHPGMIADLKGKLPLKGWNFKEERFWKE